MVKRENAGSSAEMNHTGKSEKIKKAADERGVIATRACNDRGHRGDCSRETGQQGTRARDSDNDAGMQCRRGPRARASGEQHIISVTCARDRRRMAETRRGSVDESPMRLQPHAHARSRVSESWTSL